MIKTTLDKKFGAAWHCAIGEGFGFDVTYQAKNMIYVYYNTIGILSYNSYFFPHPRRERHVFNYIFN